MIRSIRDRLTNPHAVDVIECGLIMPWEHSAPRNKDYLTFAHTNYVKVPGLAVVELEDDVLSITHRIDRSRTDYEHFKGLWALYEKPPVETEPFDTFRISDKDPTQIQLFNGEIAVKNTLCSEGMHLAANLALDHLCGRLNSKVDESIRVVA